MWTVEVNRIKEIKEDIKWNKNIKEWEEVESRTQQEKGESDWTDVIMS